jgi:hypothetical protein
MQRKHSREVFDPLLKLNPDQAHDVFMLSRNYVRLWNYGWKNPDKDQQTVAATLAAGRQALDAYCPAEETIYKSCGMPTRFRVGLSCCFEAYARGVLSPAGFRRFTFKNLQQLYDAGSKDQLAAKEKLFTILDGGDLISFYREGSPEPEEALREIGFLLQSYRFHLYRYSFTTTRQADLRLQDFG